MINNWENFESNFRRDFSEQNDSNVENFIRQIKPCFLDYYSEHREKRQKEARGAKLITRITRQMETIVKQANKFVLAHNKADELRGDLHAYLSGNRVGFGFDALNDLLVCDITPPTKDVRPPEGEEPHGNEDLNALLINFQAAIKKIESTRNNLIKSINLLGDINKRARLELAYFSKPFYSNIPTISPCTILESARLVLNKYSGMKEGYLLIDSFRRAWMQNQLPEIETGANSKFIGALAMAFGYSDGGKLKSLAQQYREIYDK